jgi:uncharacterized Zn finger protein (UPF0148 family)
MKIPATTAVLATRCAHPESRKPGHRYCPACRAAYMREWRQKQKEERTRLRAIAERYEAEESAHGR